jgi:hypothetical protein
MQIEPLRLLAVALAESAGSMSWPTLFLLLADRTQHAMICREPQVPLGMYSYETQSNPSPLLAPTEDRPIPIRESAIRPEQTAASQNRSHTGCSK